MVTGRITKKEIREMPWNHALEILIDGTKCHLTGAGCGPGHIIPVGEEKHRYMVAMAKARYKLWRIYPEYVK